MGGSSSQVNLTNTTLWNNSAEDGGGVYFHNSRGQILNSILWENTPSQGKIRSTSSLNFIKIAYSNIMDGEDGLETSSNGNIYFYDGILSEDPQFQIDVNIGPNFKSRNTLSSPSAFLSSSFGIRERNPGVFIR